MFLRRCGLTTRRVRRRRGRPRCSCSSRVGWWRYRLKGLDGAQRVRSMDRAASCSGRGQRGRGRRGEVSCVEASTVTISICAFGRTVPSFCVTHSWGRAAERRSSLRFRGLTSHVDSRLFCLGCLGRALAIRCGSGRSRSLRSACSCGRCVLLSKPWCERWATGWARAPLILLKGQSSDNALLPRQRQRARSYGESRMQPELAQTH